MLYEAYQLREDLLGPWRGLAEVGGRAMRSLPPSLLELPIMRLALAGAELAPYTGLRHARPEFGIDSVAVDGETVEVSEQAVARTPFATLLHFSKQTAVAQPRVLLVAPLSGHYATLLRATVRTMLPEHDVYLTDWHNARDIASSDGRFGLDEYIEHLIDFLGVIGGGAHLVAVCQPCPPALAATALMEAAADPCSPRSLTLMAGPIDARANPNAVNQFANERPIDWFERNLISAVPARYPAQGAGSTLDSSRPRPSSR